MSSLDQHGGDQGLEENSGPDSSINTSSSTSASSATASSILAPILSGSSLSNSSSPETNISFSNSVDESQLQRTVEKSESNEKVSELQAADRFQIEDYTQCSKSHLWKLMMSFYDRKGPDSWSQGIVPHFITCNAFIGRSYAKVLHGFLADSLRPNAALPMDPSKPLYIIELGAGSGKFSYFMLKALEEMKGVCGFPFEKIIYVMTDFTESNFKFWQNHSALKPYFDSGRLDAAIFDAVKDTSIQLWRSGEVLQQGSVTNPLCIVANYLFDTLYHDIFQVDGGELKEGLVSTGSKSSFEPDILEPSIIERLDNRYLYNNIRPDYYSMTGEAASDEDGDEPYLRRILKWYRDNFKNTMQGASFLMPIGAMRALRRLCRFSNNRAIIISGDKGNNNPEQFKGLSDPHIAVHGSFSLMVNYHAIGAYFTTKGGFALHNPQEEASLKVGCFIMMPDQGSTSVAHDNEWLGEALVNRDNEKSTAFPFLCQAFEDFMNGFGPNDFFILQKSLKEDLAAPPLRTVIAMLKLADWDPDVFFKFRDVILNQAPNSGVKLKNDLARGIHRVWKNYYIMDQEKDIAFEIGRFYYGIRDYANALIYYEESIRTVGEHHVTYHNQGLCYYSLGNKETSFKFFEKAYGMNSAYEKAKSWIDKVSTELGLGMGSALGDTNESGVGGGDVGGSTSGSLDSSETPLAG